MIQNINNIYKKIYVIGSKINKKTNMNIHFYKKRILSQSMIDDKTNLNRVYFNIINYCNLNCAYCDNFSPLAINKHEISVDLFEKTVNRLVQLFPEIPYLSIGGGEPLLHTRLLDICRILRKYYPYALISLLTNGLLLQSMNHDFYEKLKLFDIQIDIAEYPIELNYTQIYEFLNNMSYDNYIYRDKSSMINLRLHLTKQTCNKSYYKCWYAGNRDYQRDELRAVQINEYGDVFFCYLIANIHLLEQYFNITFEKIKGKYGDYVNIFEIESKEDILHGINNKIPFCNYCSSHSAKNFIVWNYSKMNISEWIE